MHNGNMSNAIKQARFDVLVEQSKLTDGDLATALGVNQSTVSRLRNGGIAKIDRHIDKLEQHLRIGVNVGVVSDERLVEELVSLSRRLPHLRDALMGMYALMRLSA